MSSFESLLHTLEQTNRPPIETWNPKTRGEIDIQIKTNGEWWHEGSPIRRHKLVKLFSSILRKEQDDYFLVTPAEKLRIQVEDSPFVAVEMQRQFFENKTTAQKLAFRTNVDDVVIASAEHQIFFLHCASGGDKPYIHVRGGLNARIERSVYYELAEFVDVAESDSNQHGVWSGGFFHVLDSA